MISDNGLWNTQESDDVIQKEKSCSTTIIQKGSHSLSPFCKVIYNDDYIIMPLVEVGLHCMKSMSHLEKGLMEIMGCSKRGGCMPCYEKIGRVGTF
jgi:hypothetical protein